MAALERPHRFGIATVAAAVLCACGRDPGGVVPPVPPIIAQATVAPNPWNVLSAVVTARVVGADSVGVRFHTRDATGVDSSAPAVIPLRDSASIPILGLLPAARYGLTMVAYGPGNTTVEVPLPFETDSLPPDLPTYAAAGVAPSPGFVAFAADPYGVVVDNAGRVVWYRRFPDGLGLDFQALSTGVYAARPATPDTSDRDPWITLDPLGDVTRTFGCARGLEPRFHDLLADADGGYWIMCDETRTLDLTAVGGLAGARVMGTVVQHIGPDEVLRFEWNPFNHFLITDLDVASRTGADVNWTHGNALALDTDGNLLVSFRSLSEITKIDVATGAVMWRLGGQRNEFTFDATSAPAFVRQHGLRVVGPGVILLLDNLGAQVESRAECYAIDADARTARQTCSFAAQPGALSLLGGSVQRLPDNRTLVSYGTAGRVEEYDSTGAVMWRIEGNAGYVFRAQRIASLYHPGIGTPR